MFTHHDVHVYGILHHTTHSAFGTYFDVMREVSYHPLMGIMLTYKEIKSMSYNFEKNGLMLFPDENVRKFVFLHLLLSSLNSLHHLMNCNLILSICCLVCKRDYAIVSYIKCLLD